jgi:glycosyltransferase involved in cell wall biosynthesis
MILLKEELGLRLGERARKRVVAHYDWSRVVVGSVNELFERAIEEKSA